MTSAQPSPTTSATRPADVVTAIRIDNTAPRVVSLDARRRNDGAVGKRHRPRHERSRDAHRRDARRERDGCADRERDEHRLRHRHARARARTRSRASCRIPPGRRRRSAVHFTVWTASSSVAPRGRQEHDDRCVDDGGIGRRPGLGDDAGGHLVLIDRRLDRAAHHADGGTDRPDERLRLQGPRRST